MLKTFSTTSHSMNQYSNENVKNHIFRSSVFAILGHIPTQVCEAMCYICMFIGHNMDGGTPIAT